MKSILPFMNRGKKARQSSRFPRFGLAELTGSDGWMGEAYVKEMSRDGARFSHDNPNSVPDRVRVAIPSEKISVEAIVKWRADGLFGVQFVKPIDVDDLSGADPSDRLRHLGWSR